MDVTPHELRTVEFREAWRGYRQDDVDELLDRVAGTIERLQGQIKRLGERLERTEQEAGVGREADEMLRRTLLLAQRTADAAVAEAQERARRVVSESEAQAHSIVSGAEEEARRVAISERQRLEAEIRDLARRRDDLVGDVEALEKSAADFRDRLREFFASQLDEVERRVPPGSAARPPLHDTGLDLDAEAPYADGADDDAVVLDDSTTEAGDDGAELDDDEGDLLPERRGRRRERGDDFDDGFFEELRQAVEDDAPLGPVDEDFPFQKQD